MDPQILTFLRFRYGFIYLFDHFRSYGRKAVMAR